MERYIITNKISLIGIAANLILLFAKLTVGFISRSQAMIADGANSAGDVIASLLTFVGNKIASKPVDDTHPYGHGKAEYIFSMIISITLIGVGTAIFRSSLMSIIDKEIPIFNWWLVTIALFTIVLKLILYIYTSKAAKREDSLLIRANSEDHRNDVLVSFSMLIGITLSSFGIYWADGAAGMGIALWIVYTGFIIFLSSFHVLMDKNMDCTMEKDILVAVQSTQGVDHVDSILAKPVGVRYIVVVKVSVPGYMTVNESHQIAGLIRSKIRSFKKVEDVIVHINPA